MKKTRENRVQIMMTEEERALVDDYRFTHRVNTRAGAIRELVRHGLRRVETLEAAGDDYHLNEWQEMSTLPPDYEGSFLTWGGFGICLSFMDSDGHVHCAAPDGDMVAVDGFTHWRPRPLSPPEEAAANKMLAGIEAMAPPPDEEIPTLTEDELMAFIDASNPDTQKH